MSSINLSSCIKEKAREIGYDLCGITSVNLIEEYSSRLDERIRNFPESPVENPDQNIRNTALWACQQVGI
ncbi:hypothetical protein [Methanosarcina sp.]|uniref:hypothetical protein n=1 Tax=Methanosarcina sp. TaxID=2213 RepID=UPI002B5151D9|nr:hypothetical protein [Methanosarcina sp.]HOW15454.1 hypothetical protein [Methanosarcina sp.]